MSYLENIRLPSIIEWFHAQSKSRVKDLAEDQSNNVIDNLLNLYLFPKNENRNHWIGELIAAILKGSLTKIKGGKYNYEWLFTSIDDEVNGFFKNRVDLRLIKENKYTPIDISLTELLNRIKKFKSVLIESYKIKRSILNKEDLIKIINEDLSNYE